MQKIDYTGEEAIIIDQPTDIIKVLEWVQCQMESKHAREPKPTIRKKWGKAIIYLINIREQAERDGF